MRPVAKSKESGYIGIGFRDRNFNEKQYNDKHHTRLYINSNPEGRRGGGTPGRRVALCGLLMNPGETVYEVGPGAGHDAKEFKNTKYNYKAGDISKEFIEILNSMGFDAGYFDARTDSIPEGINGVYAHISVGVHLNPKELAMFLFRSRSALDPPRALYLSVLEGNGHARTERTGGFLRDFYLYSPTRIMQITDHEGLHRVFLEKMTAFNETKTIHIGGHFKPWFDKSGEQSYGKKALHPFGDTYSSMDVFYQGRLAHDLLDNQVQVGLLSSEIRDYIKAAEKTYVLGRITSDDMAKEINKKWAKGLQGRDISIVMQHATDFLNQQARFYPKTETALAVCTNNGFSINLIGREPSWLIEVVANHLGMDKEFSVQWSTETRNHFQGKITGEIFYAQEEVNPAKTLLKHQKRLKDYLGPLAKRITIGIGQGGLDNDFLVQTDYPIFAFANTENIEFAYQHGCFTDKRGEAIYAGSEPWLRWAVLDNTEKLAMYLNLITSDRFPIRPDYNFKGPLWKCPKNYLRLNYYQDQISQSVHIL